MRATASSVPGRSRAQSSRTEYSCKPIGILAMGFLSSGVRLRKDNPRRTRRPQGGWTAAGIVPAERADRSPAELALVVGEAGHLGGHVEEGDGVGGQALLDGGSDLRGVLDEDAAGAEGLGD